MPDVTRRHLLSTAAAGAGGLIASSVLPPALARAAAAGPRRGSLRDVRHIVVQMQENRSFDHYFGTLAGVRGFGDPNVASGPDGRSIFYQPDPQNPDGYLLPWHLDTAATNAQAMPSTSHAWKVQHSAMNIAVGARPGAPTTAANDNWLPAHIAADGADRGPYTMGYYERQDIPFQFALAEAFTLCDGYHCSLLGPTWPNRMYLFTGMIDPTGEHGGPLISNVVPSTATGEPYTWTTYPERLTAAGVSWRVYQEEDDYGCNPLEWFGAFQDAKPGSALYEGGLTIHSHDRFAWDCANGKLPTVSWIIPTSGQSEHPAYLPASGADFLAAKLNAVATNRDLWNSTVFVVNYDENDGLFDHVIPPLPPAGTAGEFVDGVPIGGGVRVPGFVVSPWTVGGYVATENFDHTSVLQLMERVTGVTEPNITAWRRETFGDLTSALGFSRQGSTAPTLPETRAQFWAAEHEVATNPEPTFPGANQTPPIQEGSRNRTVRAPWTPQARTVRSASARRPMPAPDSRLVENRTTHASDFAGGASDKVFLARIAAVSGHALGASAGTHAWVPGICGGAASAIDTATYALASGVTDGLTNPYGIAATPDGSAVWVTNSGANTVSVIDTATSEITGTVVVGIYPHGIAITPDGASAYVANTGPNTGPGGSRSVSVIDVASLAVTGEIDVGEAPVVVALSPSGDTVYVTCADGVHAIATRSRTVIASHGGLTNPHGVTASPSGRQVWVSDTARDQVLVLSAQTLTPEAAIPVGRSPWNTAFTVDGNRAIVTNANDDSLSVIDVGKRRVVQRIALGGFSAPNEVTSGTFFQLHHQPTAVRRAPDGSLWVTCNTSSSLAVIDAGGRRVTASVSLGLSDDPTDVAFTGQ